MSASFAATPAELGLVNQIFAQIDKQKLGILQGDVAVKVFNGAKLSVSVLGEIWNIADAENNGWLSKTGVAKAVRLIAHAQQGAKVSDSLLGTPAPLPKLEGFTYIPPHATGASIPKSPPPGFPPLASQDKIKFQNIFNRSGPANGLLHGEKARDIFLRSKLSNDQLLQIWHLADTRDRGVLDVADFTVAMYFIQGLMTHQISFVPSTLPPGLYEQAGGLPSNLPASVATHVSGNSGSLSPVGNNFGQVHTGQGKPLVPDYGGLSRQPRSPGVPVRSNTAPFRPVSVSQGDGYDAWDVTSDEKAEADAIFEGQLDTKKAGYIEGDTAVPYMLQSQLPGEDLATIWDLADINKDGRLTRDGFAIAYHLIKKKLTGQPLPAQLPPSLLPPSLRNQAPFFQAPQPQPQQNQQPQPVRDLLDLDDIPPAYVVSPQATGTMSVLQPQSTGATTVPPVSPHNNASAADPFASSPFSAAFSPAPSSDLMGDHGDRLHTTSPPFQDQSAELGNAQNQLQSTMRSLDTTKAERARMERTVANQASELSALQTQLSSAKAAYDTETTVLSQLKERFTNQADEIQKVREELIRSESDLSAVRVEKAEVEQAFLRDKEEARDLHKRMIEAGQLADQLKAEVEKARKEAKQQKGRLAIARKQLSTKEAERSKAAKELEEANDEVQSVTQEAEEAEAQLARMVEQPQPVRALSQELVTIAAAQPLPPSPEQILTSKSNNPFERLVMSSSPSPRSQSPFLPFPNPAMTSPSVVSAENQNGQAKPEPQSSFDDFFGVEVPAPVAEAADKPVLQANGDSTPKDNNIEFAHVPASPVTVASTEHFVTPPTTASNEVPSGSSDNLTSAARAKFPSVDDTTASFPAVEDITIPGTEKEDEKQVPTDLGTKLQELDAERSDSDSSESDDDDDDDAPLAEVAQKAKEKGVIPTAQNTPIEISAAKAVSTPINAKSSFDNVFGTDTPPAASIITPAPEVPKPSSSPFDISQPAGPAKPNDTADVSAFDETLGGLSPPPSTAPTQFAFDGFEDSFDFGAAGGTTATSLPSSATVAASAPMAFSAPITQHSAPPVQASFENIFAVPNVAATLQQRTTSVPAANGPTARSETAKQTSFDDAFATFDANPNLNLGSSFMSTTATNNATGESQQTPPSKPFPTSAPISPKVAEAFSPKPSVNRVSSPPRSTSPVRMASPPPRKSTSSKDSHEKLKEPPTRHSKLSIRFPFGKKKNKQQESSSQPPSASSLAPPAEESYRTRTPAVDDDVEAVKQITAMGFSRSQAVDALEKYGYDVSRAINSLL